MHVLVIVAGDDVRGAMEPYADHLEVAPRLEELGPDDRAAMAERFGVDEHDLDALVPYVSEWTGCPGRVEDGRLCYETTENPNAKFDWYRVGGRFKHSLPLRVPQEPGLLGRIFGRAPRSRANRARKADVDLSALQSNLPYALVVDGVWHDEGEGEVSGWPDRVRALLESIPDDTMLNVVDAHC